MKKLFAFIIAVLLLLPSCRENTREDITNNRDESNTVEVSEGVLGDEEKNTSDAENTNSGDESTDNAENTDNTKNTDNDEDTDNTEKDENFENNQSLDTDQGVDDGENKETDDKKAESTSGFSKDSWIITPSYTFESLFTFGKSGYSIYLKDGKYGVLDMSANGIGTGDYSELFYCPTHGLSCPDILESSIKMTEDLYISPDCGYREKPDEEIIYVFDPTRDRVYLTGYDDGYFRIVDITDTEFFTQNERYTVVLYDCDADLMMYEGIGIPSLEAIFALETKEMHYGVIDRDMDYIIACVYEKILDGNDCYIVKKDGKYGYRALGGREYYPCVFEEANTAYKGAAWVKYDGRWGTVRF